MTPVVRLLQHKVVRLAHMADDFLLALGVLNVLGVFLPVCTHSPDQEAIGEFDLQPGLNPWWIVSLALTVSKGTPTNGRVPRSK